MKKRNKIMALLLTLALMLLVLAACAPAGSGDVTPGGNPGSNQTADPGGSQDDTVPTQKYVIGVVEAQANNDVSVRRQYFENYIAPNYNVEFIFSEKCADDTATKAFIESCIDMGANAIIDFKSCNTTMAKLCEDNGMVYVVNSVPRANNFDLYEGASSAFVGGVAGNNQETGATIAKWVKENSSDDGSEGFLIASAVASSGVVEHVQITTQVLQAIQDKYGLTYTQDINTIATSPDPIIVENDKGINIYVYPGSPNKDTWLPGVSPLLQTGDYGIFVSCGETYDKSANVVSEVEASKNINIKVASLGALSSSPVAFSTKDSFGNTSVDMIVCTCSSVQNAALFATAYNGLTNGADALYVDGLPTYFTCNKLGFTDLASAEKFKGWDELDGSNWVADTEFIDQMLLSKNEGATVDSIKNLLKEINLEKVLTMIG